MAGFAFPYPILGSNDSISGHFDVSLNVIRTDNRTVRIVMQSFEIDNDEILGMYEVGKCRVVLRIYCASTFYSECFEVELGSEFEIAEGLLVNSCEAELFIVMNSPIKYSLDSFLNDYNGLTFNLKKNDVIGITDVLKWDVPRLYEKLASNGIFKFSMQSNDSDENSRDIVSFNFDSDFIHVAYPFHKEVDPLSLLFKKKMYTAYWSTIIPALTEGYRIVLSDIEEVRAEYENYRWFHYLEQVMKIRDLQHLEPFEIAQKVFVNDGFTQMFEELI
jgi:hypothetical protein